MIADVFQHVKFEVQHSSETDFGNNCAHCAKSVKPGRIVVQYLSFDFFVITFFKGLFLEKE